MCLTGRLFNCALCHAQVIICSQCDRGQIYCATDCRVQARQASQRAANSRYQRTKKGKHNHAERQHRYRQNQRNQKKVTYQGSPDVEPRDVLPTEPNEVNEMPADAGGKELHCHFCHQSVSNFLRTGFLLFTQSVQRQLRSLST